MKRRDAKYAMMDLRNSTLLNPYYTEAVDAAINALQEKHVPDENVYIYTKAVEAGMVERQEGDKVSLNCSHCGVKVRKHFRYCWYCGAIFTKEKGDTNDPI